MEEIPYILTDCHTHRQDIPPNELAIFNVFLDDAIGGFKKPVSVGLHPWHTEGAVIEDVGQKLEAALHEENVMAVGEIGLDRLQGAALGHQEAILQIQIQLAVHYDKPVLFHLVRALPELIRHHKKMKPAAPWIIHGFNLRLPAAKELLDAGFLLSFGAEILRPGSPAAAALAFCPEGKFLLETDTWPGDLRLIYDKAASIRVQLPDDLSADVEQTFREVFRF